MSSLRSIQDFLNLKRLAVVGVSRNPRDFTRTLFREFQQRGYDVVPVNPNVAEVEGLPSVPHLRDVSPPVEGVLVLTPASATGDVAREAAEAGIHHIWLYRASGAGAVDPQAVQFCRTSGIDVVDGECPFMFFDHPAWFHRFHGFCRKVMGQYPD